MSKQIKFNDDARLALQRGLDKVADAVGVTLGAKGRNVIIQNEHGGSPHVTKDGVSVARSINLPDHVENMGATLLIEAASKTVNEAGDGTSSTCVLAQSLVREGLKAIKDNPKLNPMDIKKGIDKGVEIVVEKLEELAIPVESEEQLKSIATISANNDENIGGLIATAVNKVTKDGVIRVEDSKNNDTYVDLVDGTQFINGLLSPYFINNPKKLTTEYENPLILFYDGKVAHTKDIVPIINIAIAQHQPLVIIANDFDGEVIATLVQNKKQINSKIVPVKAPSYGDKRTNFVNDLCLLTGATLISEQTGDTVDKFQPSMFGTATKVVIDPERTTIIKGGGDPIEIKKHIEDLKEQAKEAKHEVDEEDFRNRIAKLMSGIAVIYIGANSEVELNEKKDRIDDALHATKAATEEGIVAGGGIALLNCVRDVINFSVTCDSLDTLTGLNVLGLALSSPFGRMFDNAGLDSVDIFDNVKDQYPEGFNLKTEQYENLIESGVVDPKKVTRVALESAASIATMILTTEATVSSSKE